MRVQALQPSVPSPSGRGVDHAMVGRYLTDERRMIQEQARDFATREVLPVANNSIEGEIPMALRKKIAEMGHLGILVDEKFGGLGLGAFGTSEAIRIHCGAGYTTLHAVERRRRDARLTKTFEGTSEIQLRIISDQLLGK